MKTFMIIISVAVLLVTNPVSVMSAVPGLGCFFQDDPLNGPKKEYYPNGKIMKEYTLSNGKIEGSLRFYNTLGKLVSDQYCKNGEPNGLLKTYYENGQLKSEGNMKPGGDISGPTREFYDDGTLKSEGMISGQMPKLSSQMKVYSKNGKLQSETVVSNGEFVYCITYDNEGRVSSEQKPGNITTYSYDRDGKRHVSINGVPQD